MNDENKDYKVSIDYANGELRPTFHEDAIQLIERDDDNTAITFDDRTHITIKRLN